MRTLGPYACAPARFCLSTECLLLARSTKIALWLPHGLDQFILKNSLGKLFTIILGLLTAANEADVP